MELTRINKFIADSGIASRRKAEELILQQRVTVNTKVISSLAFKIDPDKDIVRIDGEKIELKRNVYYLLNKPKGVISSTHDEKSRRTVVDLIKTKEKIYPVGRLDFNTTGVLLLTNDGDFSNLLTHPKNKVPRKYVVKLDKELVEEDRIKLLRGIIVEKRKGRFKKIKLVNIKDRSNIEIECVEGRNHFVKKMFNALNYNVKKLNRSSFAGIKADIPVGMYRKLNESEVQNIVSHYTNHKPPISNQSFNR
ncbi:rRNA pseudouridine synthase [bacterium BMS3Abin03]|nr:rRNA pseudouridine synthase [bacterium BMS3Abin03]